MGKRIILVIKSREKHERINYCEVYCRKFTDCKNTENSLAFERKGIISVYKYIPITVDSTLVTVFFITTQKTHARMSVCLCVCAH